MIFETYSARLRKAQRGNEPDVYTYDAAPRFMRQQIAAALDEGIGVYDPIGHELYEANDWWKHIDRICAKEVEGYADLDQYSLSPRDRLLGTLVAKDDMLSFLDITEIACRFIFLFAPSGTIERRGASLSASDAIEEINGRFRQHGVGYQIHDGHIIHIDSEFAHQEIVKPALLILGEERYRKASEDFLTAHHHYRAGKYKDAVTAANRAFESTLKAICDAEKWSYQSGDNAAQLVTLVSQKGLFTHAFDKSFNSFIAMMKTGLPSIRNDAGAHGESLEANAVTAEIARYAINMTATNILFLAECHERFQQAHPH